MKRSDICYIWLLLTFSLLTVSSDVSACYGIIAGKNTTYDGSVMIGHAEQNGSPAFLNFLVVPRFRHEPGSFVKFYGGGLYPQPAETYSYIWSENFGKKGSDAIMNEWGVICVSDGTITKEDSPEMLFKRGDVTNDGVVIEIRIEIAKRAKTARQAVLLAAKMVEMFGFNGQGGTHIIADPNEAWLFTCVGGRHWVAARVPDDKVVILSNVNVIREVNLNDSINFLASADIIEYAVKRGWYKSLNNKVFDFKKAYDKIHTNAFELNYGCDARQWRGQCLVTGKSIDLPVRDEGLPFAVTPMRKLTIMDMRNILSDHLEGTKFDKSNTEYLADSKYNIKTSSVCSPPKDISEPELYKSFNYSAGSPHRLMDACDGMICSDNLQEIAIFQLRSWMPAEIGCVYWKTTAAPCSSVLTPWYLGINETPEAYHKDYKIEDNIKYDFHFSPPQGTFDYDPGKAFWLFNSIENMVDQDYGKYIIKVRKAYDSFEQNEINMQADIEKQALRLYKADKAEARKFLTDYSGRLALQAIEIANRLEKELKTDLLGF